MAGIKHDPTTHTYGGSMSSGMSGMGGGDWIVNTGPGSAAGEPKPSWIMYGVLAVGVLWLLKAKKT